MTDTSVETVECVYCGRPNLLERVTEMGYTHCSRVECVGAWRRKRLDDAGLVPTLMHKQGLAWVYRDEVKKNDMKRSGGT